MPPKGHEKAVRRSVPGLSSLPRPVYGRTESLPNRALTRRHSHPWVQLSYAISGVLEIQTSVGRFVAPPQRAVWIPAGMPHRVFSSPHTEMRSLYLDCSVTAWAAERCQVLEVSSLLRELIRNFGGVGNRPILPRGHRVLIASANPGEGKTFSAVNLALSLAVEADHDVLLIDADIAKPSVLEALGLEDGPGLMDALADAHLPLGDCLIQTDIPGLKVMPAGTGHMHDTELLASARTDALLAQLEQGVPGRILIIDSPPVLAASPAAVLAGHVGQTIMVVRADETLESALRDAIGLMGACPHIQLLLNGVKYSPGGRRFGTYYGQGGA